MEPVKICAVASAVGLSGCVWLGELGCVGVGFWAGWVSGRGSGVGAGRDCSCSGGCGCCIRDHNTKSEVNIWPGLLCANALLLKSTIEQNQIGRTSDQRFITTPCRSLDGVSSEGSARAVFEFSPF